MPRRGYDKGGIKYGTGTQSDPFLIYTPEDLALVRDLTNANSEGSYHDNHTTVMFEGQFLKIVADLDMSSICYSGKNWDSIGKPDGVGFKGCLDGDNHTISNIYTVATVSSTANRNCGFIYSLTAAGVVKNITFDSFHCEGYRAAPICYNAGLIENCISKNCNFYGYQQIGGIVGQTQAGGITQYCENYSSQFKAYYHYSQIGGICGINYGLVKNCINYADITASTSSDYHIGGIVGTNYGTSNNLIVGCINFGKIRSAATLSGCIAGHSKFTMYYNMNCGWLNSRSECSGILGYDDGSSKLYGNLNIGNIEPYSGAGSYEGAIAKYGMSASDLFYNYCDSQHSNLKGFGTSDSTSNDGAVSKTTAQLVCQSDDSAPSGISTASGNTYFTATNWVFKQGLYPYPKGIKNEDAAICAASPIYLDAADTYKTVSHNFTVSTLYGVSWSSSNSNVVSINGGIATIVGTGTCTLTNYRDGKPYRRTQITVINI